MPKFRIEKLDPNLTQPADIPGLAATIDLPDLPNPIKSWRALVVWFRNHPEVLTTIWRAILQLLGPAQDQDQDVT